MPSMEYAFLSMRLLSRIQSFQEAFFLNSKFRDTERQKKYITRKRLQFWSLWSCNCFTWDKSFFPFFSSFLM